MGNVFGRKINETEEYKKKSSEEENTNIDRKHTIQQERNPKHVVSIAQVQLKMKTSDGTETVNKQAQKQREIIIKATKEE
jgi:hypothetical protein